MLVLLVGVVSCKHEKVAVPAAASTSPAILLGSWFIAAEGEEPGAVLNVTGEMSLVRRCGDLMIDWRGSSSGLLLTAFLGGSSACYPKHATPEPRWVNQAHGFRAKGSSREFLDAAGVVVATLAPGASPAPDVPGLVTDPAQVRRAVEGAGDVPHLIPRGWTAAKQEDLVGRWVPDPMPRLRLATDTPAGAVFNQDGSFTAADGCNGYGQRWTAGDHGEFLSIQGAVGGVACSGDVVPVEQWVQDAVTVGIRANRLGFFNRSGKELGHLTRVS